MAIFFFLGLLGLFFSLVWWFVLFGFFDFLGLL